MKRCLLPMALAICSSCVDSPVPSSTLLPEQVESMDPAQAQERLLSGIVAFVNNFATWSSSDLYYTQDWGYPCQMFHRDVLCCDIPVSGGAYNYWVNVEKSEALTGASAYTYYYYCFVKRCNELIALVDPETASVTSRQNLGCALTFRALCYLDLVRMFEFMPTGYKYYDDEATNTGIWGLTVPIVSDLTPDDQLNKNPRAPFTTMYRFILNDLNRAEQMLAAYNRPADNYPDQSVVCGLQARLWLEMATRFERSDADLKAQMALEGCADGYADLGVTTANDCFARAADYARRAQAGRTPMSQREWTEPTTGFNTATGAWMLCSRVSTQEQEANYFSSLLGTVCTEATWGMAQYGGGNYRCIGDWLYKRMSDDDWRKLSWLDPIDVEVAKKAIKLRDKTLREEAFAPLKDKYGYTVSDTIFSRFPQYANLKFRTRDVKDMIEGLKCDLPLMRVEEMFFIEAEAEAHLNGYKAGEKLLEDFINGHRYTSPTYACGAYDLKDFTAKLVEQKRIEFWGEGLVFFDYKRLRLAVSRSDNTNYPADMCHDSKDGYVCPAMNYYILNNEINNNPAVVANPDCTKWYDKN